MRQAILITAYRDSAQLQRLVDYFDSDFELFIHIDRQSHLHLDGQHISSNVHVYQCYPTPWGSVNHLHAILLLMHEAARRQDLEYFHLATGSDYPIPPLPDFKSFCEAHREENYLEHFPLPRTAWDGEGGIGAHKLLLVATLAKTLYPDFARALAYHNTCQTATKVRSEAPVLLFRQPFVWRRNILEHKPSGIKLRDRIPQHPP